MKLHLIWVGMLAGALAVSAADNLKRYPRPDLPGEAWAVRVEDAPLAFTGQVLPWDSGGGFPSGARAQADQAIANLRAVLGEAGCDPDQIIRIEVCVVSDDVSSAVDAAFAAALSDHPPALTFVRSPAGPKEALLSLAAVAEGPRTPSGGRPISVFPLTGAPAGVTVAIMPAGQRMFFSGTATHGNDLPANVTATLAAVGRHLQALGVDKSAVVQMRVILGPYSRREVFDRAMADFFAGSVPPPLITFERSSTSTVEIDVTAGGNGRSEHPTAPLTHGMYADSPITGLFSSMGIVAPGIPLIFTAGLEGGTGDPRAQAEAAYLRLSSILFETGSSYGLLVKANGYLVPLHHYAGSPPFNDIRRVFYQPDALPASTTTAFAGIGRPGRVCEVDMIAVPMPKSPAASPTGAK